MKTTIAVSVAVLGSMLLSGCLTTAYMLSEAKNSSLPNPKRDLNTWATPNPQPKQRTGMEIVFDAHAPKVVRVPTLKLEYVAGNCPFKQRGAEGLTHAQYPRNSINLAASSPAAQTYRYEFYQDAFLEQSDELGRRCEWQPYSAAGDFVARDAANGAESAIWLQWFGRDMTRQKTLTRYFSRQAKGGRYEIVNETAAKAQPEQVFSVTIRYY